MAESLTLDTAETKPGITSWRVRHFFIDRDGPSVKIEFAANTGETRIWRYVVDATTTETQVRNAISFINQGKFMTVDGKSLQKWLIHKAQGRGILGTGTVSGTVE